MRLMLLSISHTRI